jgi:hypothetical protein
MDPTTCSGTKNSSLPTTCGRSLPKIRSLLSQEVPVAFFELREGTRGGERPEISRHLLMEAGFGFGKNETNLEDRREIEKEMESVI